MSFFSFMLLMFPFYSVLSVLVMIAQMLLLCSARNFLIRYLPLFLSFIALNVFTLCIFMDTGASRRPDVLVSVSFLMSAVFLSDLSLVLVNGLFKNVLSCHIRRCLDA